MLVFDNGNELVIPRGRNAACTPYIRWAVAQHATIASRPVGPIAGTLARVTETNTDADADTRQPTGFDYLVSRPALAPSTTGAVIALSGLAVWPGEYYSVIRTSLCLLSVVTILAVLVAAGENGRYRWALWAPGAVLAYWVVTGFWPAPREANMIADVVTAVIFLITGFVVRLGKTVAHRKTLGWIYTIAAVILIWSAVTTITGAREYQECLADVSTYESREEAEEICSYDPRDDE